MKHHGTGIVGFCEIPSTLQIAEIDETFPRAIVFGFSLSKSVLNTIMDRPTLLYKNHYKTVNWMLDQTGFRLSRFIEELGSRALALPASQTVDWEKQKGHVSHKALAVAAGLGHIGRSGLVIHPRLGAQVRYASVFTDMEFPVSAKAVTSCGNCMKCVAACPARAIEEDGIDLAKCLDKLREFSKVRGIGQYICGVCVKVCDGRH
ncbi:MAG: epoxyqueuosine reductase [candidate division WOR-3 bacterium]|nr:MAG: epoxyqueuosine reductase [candidate division WOR-3 bacterium]